MTPSDLDLVDEALRGRRESFDALLLRYRRAIFGYFVACGCRKPDVDDLCQETFVTAYLSLAQFRRSERFGAWISGIARHVLSTHRRQSRARLRALRKFGIRFFGKSSNPVATPVLEDGENWAQAMERIMESLPDPFREVLYLRYDQRLRIEEIAQVEGITRAAAKMRLSRARKQLQDKLAQWDLFASRGHTP